MSTDDKPRRPSPRERARAHLRHMLHIGSLAAVVVSGSEGCGDPVPGPDPFHGDDSATSTTSTTGGNDSATSTTGGNDSTTSTSTTGGNDSATSTTGADGSSTTFDDPCSPDGCDPVPPPTTSETGTSTGSGTSGSGTTGG